MSQFWTQFRNCRHIEIDTSARTHSLQLFESVTDGDELLAEKLADPVEVVDRAVKTGGNVAGAENALGMYETFKEKEKVVSPTFLDSCGSFQIAAVVGKYHHQGEQVHC